MCAWDIIGPTGKSFNLRNVMPFDTLDTVDVHLATEDEELDTPGHVGAVHLG